MRLAANSAAVSACLWVNRWGNFFVYFTISFCNYFFSTCDCACARYLFFFNFVNIYQVYNLIFYIFSLCIRGMYIVYRHVYTYLIYIFNLILYLILNNTLFYAMVIYSLSLTVYNGLNLKWLILKYLQK